MKEIDLKRLREALPERAKMTLKKKKGIISFDCFIPEPSLTDEDWKQVKDWQREIIGKELISEFYTEETGRHWIVYLKRVPMEFINLTDEDVNTYAGFDLTNTI